MIKELKKKKKTDLCPKYTNAPLLADMATTIFQKFNLDVIESDPYLTQGHDPGASLAQC